MATLTARARPFRSDLLARRRTSSRDDLVTSALAAWVMGGLFLDGWAHNNLTRLETFLTPWHAVLYSGFVALACWIVAVAVRERRPGQWLWKSLPVGYEYALLGIVIFAAGGVTDGIWHTVFGIETSIRALLSPPHLVLLSGASLIIAAPFRAAWQSDEPGVEPSLGEFLPPFLSLLMLTLLAAFFFQYLSAFISRSPAQVARPASLDRALEENGIAALIITDLIMVAPLLLMVRRWRPPFGCVTLLFGSVALLVNAMHGLPLPWVVLSSAAAGVAVDVALTRLRPGPGRLLQQRLAGPVAAAALWSGYFLALQLRYGLRWSVELWFGTLCMTVLAATVLAYLMLPAPLGAQASRSPGASV